MRKQRSLQLYRWVTREQVRDACHDDGHLVVQLSARPTNASGSGCGPHARAARTAARRSRLKLPCGSREKQPSSTQHLFCLVNIANRYPHSETIAARPDSNRNVPDRQCAVDRHRRTRPARDMALQCQLKPLGRQAGLCVDEQLCASEDSTCCALSCWFSYVVGRHRPNAVLRQWAVGWYSGGSARRCNDRPHRRGNDKD